MSKLNIELYQLGFQAGLKHGSREEGKLYWKDLAMFLFGCVVGLAWWVVFL